MIKNKPKKGGRPKIKVDAALVEKLAGIGCPNKEIAAIVGCSVDTLDRRCADVIAKGRENGKTRIRQKQIQVALGGNVAMLIFLGKNMLGQTDKQEITGIENASTVNILLGQQQEEQLAQLVSMAQASATKPPAPARLIDV
jgi:hypothetical protein